MRIQAHVSFFPHCLCRNFLMGAKVVFFQKTCPAVPGGWGGGRVPVDRVRLWHTLGGSAYSPRMPCDLPSFFCPLADPHILFQLSNFPTCPSQPRGGRGVCGHSLPYKPNCTFFFSSSNWTSASSHLILFPRINPPSSSCLQGYVSECDDFFPPWFTFVPPGSLHGPQPQRGSSTSNHRIPMTRSW